MERITQLFTRVDFSGWRSRAVARIALRELRVRTGDAMRLRNESACASQSSDGDEFVIDGYAWVGELQDVNASRAPLCSSEEVLIPLHRGV